MFGFDASYPETYWLTVTNIGLGVAVFGGLGVVLFAIVRELLGRIRQRRVRRGHTEDQRFWHELGVRSP